MEVVVVVIINTDVCRSEVHSAVCTTTETTETGWCTRTGLVTESAGDDWAVLI